MTILGKILRGTIIPAALLVPSGSVFMFHPDQIPQRAIDILEEYKVADLLRPLLSHDHGPMVVKAAAAFAVKPELKIGGVVESTKTSRLPAVMRTRKVHVVSIEDKTPDVKLMSFLSWNMMVALPAKPVTSVRIDRADAAAPEAVFRKTAAALSSSRALAVQTAAVVSKSDDRKEGASAILSDHLVQGPDERRELSSSVSPSRSAPDLVDREEGELDALLLPMNVSQLPHKRVKPVPELAGLFVRSFDDEMGEEAGGPVPDLTEVPALTAFAGPAHRPASQGGKALDRILSRGVAAKETTAKNVHTKKVSVKKAHVKKVSRKTAKKRASKKVGKRVAYAKSQAKKDLENRPEGEKKGSWRVFLAGGPGNVKDQTAK